MTSRPEGSLTRFIVPTALLTAVVLGLGVYLGAGLFSRPQEAPTDSQQPAKAPSIDVTERPTLRALPLPERVEARLAALEKSVDDLRASHGALTDRIRPALEDYEKFHGEGVSPGKEPSLVAPAEIEAEPAGDNVRRVARALGLDATRREVMATEFARTMTDLEALEKAHAEVARDGTVTTIKIGKYGDQAAGALQRWHDWVDRNLTPQEKEAYERDHSESKLIGMRAGMFDRTISIDETGGALQFKESIATRDGQRDVLKGSAPAEARDLVLDRYSHLLPPVKDR